MVEPIQSREIFGNISVTRGAAPVHTTPGHEACAYYYDTSWPADRPEIKCSHGVAINLEDPGAFYSEDLVKQLKELSHFLINRYDIEQQMPAKIEALRKLTV